MTQPETQCAKGTSPQDGKPSRFAVSVLVVALVSCIGLMLPMLFAGPLVLDEYGTYWIAGDGPLSLWERSLNYENIPPLAPAINRLFLRLFGESEFVFRLPSALCYVASIALIFQLGRRVKDADFGALLALILAWHPVLLDEVRIARCYGLTLLLSIVVLHSTVLWIKSLESTRYPLIWALSSVLLIWTHYLNVLLVLMTSVPLAWYLFSDSFYGKNKLLMMWAIIGCCVYPLLPSLIRMSVWGEYFGFQTEASVTETVSSFWWAGLPAALVARYVFHRGGYLNSSSRNTGKRLRWVLFFCCVVPMLGAILFCRGDFASLANPRYRTCVEAAGICLWLGIVSKQQKPIHSIAVVCIGLVVTWIGCGHLPWHPKRLSTPQSAQWKEMAVRIQSDGHSEQTIFVQSGLGEAALLRDFFADDVLQDYVACRMGRMYIKGDHRRIGLPFVWNLNPEMNQWYRDQLRGIAASRTNSFWLAAATDTDLNETSSLYFEEMAREEGFEMSQSHVLPKAKLILFQHRNPQP